MVDYINLGKHIFGTGCELRVERYFPFVPANAIGQVQANQISVCVIFKGRSKISERSVLLPLTDNGSPIIDLDQVYAKASYILTDADTESLLKSRKNLTRNEEATFSQMWNDLEEPHKPLTMPGSLVPASKNTAGSRKAAKGSALET